MENKFTFRMQMNPFTQTKVDRDLIKAALDAIFDDAMLGIYNFFVLENNDSFVQTVFEDGIWHVEVSLEAGKLFEKEFATDSEALQVFNAFYDGQKIELASYKKVEF